MVKRPRPKAVRVMTKTWRKERVPLVIQPRQRRKTPEEA